MKKKTRALIYNTDYVIVVIMKGVNMLNLANYKDVHALEGVLVPPLTFASVEVQTDLEAILRPIWLHRDVCLNTPLVISNTPVTPVNEAATTLLVRNSFIDNSLVEFVLNIKGERIPLQQVPSPVKKAARTFYENELNRLDIHNMNKEVDKKIFKSLVPRGTVYIAKGDLIGGTTVGI